MSLIGNVGPYEESEKFTTYVARVKLYFTANQIAQERQVPAFLSIIGPKLFALTSDLVSPRSPQECSLDELITALNNHFKPQVIVIYERFKFYNRSQEQHENVMSYVAALKSLASTCDFGDRLEEMLRDRVVMGLREEGTQRVLLTERNLTFARAVEIAIAREAAARDVKEFGHKQSNNSAKEVNIVKTTKTNFAKKPRPVGGKEKPSKPEKPCSGCGKYHWKNDCPFKDKDCFSCKKKGHISKVCLNKGKQNSSSNFQRGQPKAVGSVETTNTIDNNARENEYIFSTQCSTLDNPFYVTLILDKNISMPFQVDTGAARTLISESKFLECFPNTKPRLWPTKTELKRYGGSKIQVCGEIYVQIELEGTVLHDKPIIVVKDLGPNLLGRDLLPKLNISLSVGENCVQSISDNSIIGEFPDLFNEEVGCYKGMEVSFSVDDAVSPKFFKARNVPYAMRAKLDSALDDLLEKGIIEQVAHSNWAAPIVPVLKGDGSVRICGDYRLTVNKACKVTQYPVPRIDDLFATLGKGKIFSKLDMKSAYNQIIISPECRALTTINTHRGLFQYNRLCFGVASAPGIFQQVMENLLRGIPGVSIFLDDILVSGSTEKEHRERLRLVLTKLNDAGLKLHVSKCSIGVNQVEYLGYTIDATGLKPTPDKLDAIVKAPEPKDLTQLRSYLGMLNFYRKFLVHAASVLEPLNRLLRKEESWKWDVEQSKAFQDSKSLLLDACLIHFNPDLPIVVSADSSKYGIGAVLCQKKDGAELPVVFASRSLNRAEVNYTMTEKEALALIFALKKFHHYLWGHTFTLITDHKPLLGLFNPNKPIPEMASGRIQRWSLMLQAYSFELFHRSGKSLGTADALSRLPLDKAPEIVPVCSEWIQLVNTLDATPVTASDISKWTSSDPMFAKVLLYLDCGWPETVETDLKPFFHRRNELSVQQGCILWGPRVVIPPQGRKDMLKELHQEHLGSTKMKQLARSYVWWPGLDRDLEELSVSCSICLSTRASPKKAPLHPWDWPEKPWIRVHVDYAGPVMNTYFLVIIDAHSKWIEVLPTRDTSSTATINLIRNVFAHFGLPMTLVSDNGPNFTSREFNQFLEKNGIKHVTSAPYQPSTNGQAENAVKGLKNFLKHCADGDWKVKLDKYLFQYRVTPHSTTNVSPAELMFGRKLRTVFDLVHPGKTLKQIVLSKQQSQKSNFDSKVARNLELSPETSVMIKNYSSATKERWIPARVVEQTGPVSYKCELTGGRVVRRHQDQILRRTVPMEGNLPMESTLHEPGDSLTSVPTVPEELETFRDRSEAEMPARGTTPVRRSTRVIKPPDRLDL